MNDFPTALVIVIALGVAVYLAMKVGRTPGSAKPPPGQPKGTLALGQYAVQPGAQWLVLGPGNV